MTAAPPFNSSISMSLKLYCCCWESGAEQPSKSSRKQQTANCTFLRRSSLAHNIKVKTTMNIVENRPVHDPPAKAAGSSSRLPPCKTKVEPRKTNTLDESLFTIRQGAKKAILGSGDHTEAGGTEVSSLSTENTSSDSFLANGSSTGQQSPAPLKLVASSMSDDSFGEMEDEDDPWWEDPFSAKVNDDEDGTVETNETSKSSQSKDTKGSRKSRGKEESDRSRRKEKTSSSLASRSSRPKEHRSRSGDKKSTLEVASKPQSREEDALFLSNGVDGEDARKVPSPRKAEKPKNVSDKSSRELASSRHHRERSDGDHLQKSEHRRSHHHRTSKSSHKCESTHNRKGEEQKSSKSNPDDVDFPLFEFVDNDDDNNGEFADDSAAFGYGPQEEPEPRKPQRRRSSISKTAAVSVRRRVERRLSQGHVPPVAKIAQRRSSGLQEAAILAVTQPPPPPQATTGDQPTTNRRRTFRRTSRSDVDLLGDDED